MKGAAGLPANRITPHEKRFSDVIDGDTWITTSGVGGTTWGYRLPKGVCLCEIDLSFCFPGYAHTGWAIREPGC